MAPGTASKREQRPGVGVGVIVRRGDEVLLVQRKYHGAGTWAAPGGYLDLGESFEQCAEREVWEETGVEIADTQVVATANDLHPDGKHNVTVWLAAQYRAGEARLAAPDEAAAVEWFPRDHLPTDLYLSTRNFVDGRCYPAHAAEAILGAPDPAV